MGRKIQAKRKGRKMPARGFTTGRRQAKRSGLVPMSDVLRFCRGAAALALSGPQWSKEDRADVAAELAAQVWCTAVAMRANGAAEEIAPSSLRGPAPKMSKRATAKRTPIVRVTVDAVPAELVTGARLYGAASNAKRALTAERERLRKEGAERARSEGFRPSSHGAYPEGIPADPAAAHRHARQILSDLGAARLGRLYPATYAACREAAGMTGTEIAAELRMNPGTLKARKSTAAQLLPSAAVYSPLAHADALRVDYWAPPLRVKEPSLPGSLGARLKPGNKFPNATDRRPTADGYVAILRPSAIVQATPVQAKRLTGGRRKFRPTDAAQWTANLSAPLRGKLAQAAQNQRARAAGKTEEQRAADKLAAGIPAPKGTARLAPRDPFSPVPTARYGKAPEWHPPLAADRAMRRLSGPAVGGALRAGLPIGPHRGLSQASHSYGLRNGARVAIVKRTPSACRCGNGACSVHPWRLRAPRLPAVWKAPKTAASRRVAADLLAAEQGRLPAERAKRPVPKRASRPIPPAPRKRRPVARYGADTPWSGQRVVRRAERAPLASAYQRACHAERRELAQWADDERRAKLARDAERAAAERAAAWEARR